VGRRRVSPLFIGPTVIFIVAISAVIIGGLVRAHPVVPVAHNLPQVTQTIGLLLLLRAFASGCSALTGVEAIANAVPRSASRGPPGAAHRMWLGILLGAMLLGLAVLIRKFHATPSPSETVLAEADRRLARPQHRVLRRAADHHRAARARREHVLRRPAGARVPAGQGQLPAALFSLRASRQVHRYGVGVLAAAAAILLVASSGDTQALIPLSPSACSWGSRCPRRAWCALA